MLTSLNISVKLALRKCVLAWLQMLVTNVVAFFAIELS